jgi:hypothetical protein
MKALTKEEMKKIGAAGACSRGYACINHVCWFSMETKEGTIWVTYGDSCG